MSHNHVIALTFEDSIELELLVDVLLLLPRVCRDVDRHDGRGM